MPTCDPPPMSAIKRSGTQKLNIKRLAIFMSLMFTKRVLAKNLIARAGLVSALRSP